MTTRILAYGLIAATLALHGVIAWVSPIQGEAWDHLVALRTQFEPTAYTTFSDLAGLGVAASTVFHTIATPLVGLALVLGMFVHAKRRLPSFDRGADLFVFAVLFALIFLATPRAGVVWFHRSYAATWLYGSAIALWVTAPYRCGWQPRGIWLPAIFVGGVCAGSSTRQIGLLALIVVIVTMRRTAGPRPRWMWLGLAGLVAGTVAVFLDSPQIDFKGFRVGFERSLGGIGMSVREGAELISLLLGFSLAKLVLGHLRPRWAGEATVPDTRETMSWMWAWFGLAVFSLFGPRPSEALLFPASIMLCIAAVPYFEWLASSRPLRIAIIGIVAGTQVVVWSYGLAHYRRVGAEFEQRVARLESAPAGSIATIEPYSHPSASYWIYGEDWASSSVRQPVAIALFGLRDVDFATAFRGYEPNPRLDIRFEIEGVDGATLAAALPPRAWATDATAAREQFADLIARLGPNGNGTLSARLVVTNLELPALRGRPLLVASYERGRLLTLDVVRRVPDDESVQAISVTPRSLVIEFPEAYALVGNRTASIPFERGAFRLQTMTTERHGVIACDPVRCLLLDAFLPQL